MGLIHKVTDVRRGAGGAGREDERLFNFGVPRLSCIIEDILWCGSRFQRGQDLAQLQHDQAAVGQTIVSEVLGHSSFELSIGQHAQVAQHASGQLCVGQASKAVTELQCKSSLARFGRTSGGHLVVEHGICGRCVVERAVQHGDDCLCAKDGLRHEVFLYVVSDENKLLKRARLYSST